MHCKNHFKRCAEQDLKGTILLSTEGINFFLAGSQTQIDGFIAYLEQDERFVEYLESIVFWLSAVSSYECAFEKEIISLGLDHIKPAEFTVKKSRQQNSKNGSMKAKKSSYSIHETIMSCVGTFENAMNGHWVL